jgi:hypothetical protein
LSSRGWLHPKLVTHQRSSTLSGIEPRSILCNSSVSTTEVAPFFFFFFFFLEFSYINRVGLRLLPNPHQTLKQISHSSFYSPVEEVDVLLRVELFLLRRENLPNSSSKSWSRFNWSLFSIEWIFMCVLNSERRLNEMLHLLMKNTWLVVWLKKKKNTSSSMSNLNGLLHITLGLQKHEVLGSISSKFEVLLESWARPSGNFSARSLFDRD